MWRTLSLKPRRNPSLQHQTTVEPWPTRRRTPIRTAACSTSSSRSLASRRPRSRSAAMTTITAETAPSAPGSPRPWRMRRWAAAAAAVAAAATTTTRIRCRCRPRSGLGGRAARRWGRLTRKLSRGGVSRAQQIATSLLVMNC